MKAIAQKKPFASNKRPINRSGHRVAKQATFFSLSKSNNTLIQRKPACPCDGGCPRCLNTHRLEPLQLKKSKAKLVKHHNTGLISRYVDRFTRCCPTTLPTPSPFGMDEDRFAGIDIYARSDHGFGQHTIVAAIGQNVYDVEFQLRTRIPIPIRLQMLHGASLVRESHPSLFVRRLQLLLLPGSQWRIWYGPARSQRIPPSFLFPHMQCVPCRYQLIGEGERLMSLSP